MDGVATLRYAWVHNRPWFWTHLWWVAIPLWKRLTTPIRFRKIKLAMWSAWHADSHLRPPSERNAKEGIWVSVGRGWLLVTREDHPEEYWRLMRNDPVLRWLWVSKMRSAWFKTTLRFRRAVVQWCYMTA